MGIATLFIISLHSVDDLQLCNIVLVIIWRRRNCAHPGLFVENFPGGGVGLAAAINNGRDHIHVGVGG